MAKKNSRKSDRTAGNNGTRHKSENGQSTNEIAAGHVEYVSLSQETRRRYLNYALSVITSRALPDVRDGLKPVQRRILYVMFQGLRLTADSKRRKSMKVCGDTTGNFHPHGDAAVYEALVRLAQDFTLRYPLVDGQGNFGSVLGLPHAAARYTEVKLSRIAAELMEELRFQTVDMRPNYDGSVDEPTVLPARLPHLLVNGTTGIAVGMATNIPPHNLTEVVKACIQLIKNPSASVAQLMRTIKGPDFPLGGRIVTDRATIKKCYEEGRGSIKVRGEWKLDQVGRKEVPNRIVIYSVPYTVSTNPLVESLGELCEGRKLPQLVSVLDETNEKNGLRILLELKSGADPQAVMEYIYKHTALEQNFAFNLTALIPDETGVGVPARLSLVELLQEFLNFRLRTVRRRFEYQLEQLEKRIHILKGFAILFDGLDKALKLIRNSNGKQDAADKLMRAFPLDALQTNAILELMLYRISQLEIDQILLELREKEQQANEIRKILASEKKLWGVVETELEEILSTYGDQRRTIVGSTEDIAEYDPEAYIVRENTNVVITHEGWVKRVNRLQNVETTRVREGDSVLDVLPGSTVDAVVFFATDGTAYTLRIDQIPVSSGYGEPLAKHFRFGDGADVVAALTTDARFTPAESLAEDDDPPEPYLFVATAMGQVMKVSLSSFREPSNKKGRRYCRLRKGDHVVHVQLLFEQTTVFLVTEAARLIHFSLDDVPILSGAGLGVKGIKLEKGDRVLGARLLSRPGDTLKVINSNGTQMSFGQLKYGVTGRGGKGVRTSQRHKFKKILPLPIVLVDWSELDS